MGRGGWRERDFHIFTNTVEKNVQHIFDYRKKLYLIETNIYTRVRLKFW